MSSGLHLPKRYFILDVRMNLPAHLLIAGFGGFKNVKAVRGTSLRYTFLSRPRRQLPPREGAWGFSRKLDMQLQGGGTICRFT